MTFDIFYDADADVYEAFDKQWDSRAQGATIEEVLNNILNIIQQKYPGKELQITVVIDTE